MTTDPPTALPTLVTVKDWPPSFAAPLPSVSVRTPNGITRTPESSATGERGSSTATGLSLTSVTVTAADAARLRPAPPASVAAWAVKLNASPAGLFKSAVGLNRTTTAPLPFNARSESTATGVVPSAAKSVPLTKPPTLTCVTSGPSKAFREIVIAPDKVSSAVVVPAVTVGASATAVMVNVAVPASARKSSSPAVVPSSSTT